MSAGTAALTSTGPDAELVAAARAGDKPALAALLQRHRPMVIALCRRALGDAHLAEDAFQEAALQTMLDLARLRRPEVFGSWLAGIALNVCRRWVRERAHEPWSWEAMWGGRAADLEAANEPGPEELAEEADLVARVRRAVAGLPKRQRETVTLFYLAGLTGEEVAAAQGIRVGAARTRLHRARSMLHERLWATWKEEVVGIDQEAGFVAMRVADVRRGPKREDLPQPYVVFLEERGGERRLPIWIGSFEAIALAMTLEKAEMVRPGPYQFTENVLGAAGGRIREVRINRLEEGTFYAETIVEGPAGVSAIDCRPSDAMNLALVSGAPIRVDPDLLGAVQLESRLPLTIEECEAEFPDGTTEIVTETKEERERQLRSLRRE
jgi:RNA polymerase sigma factor (sigma-70 family)